MHPLNKVPALWSVVCVILGTTTVSLNNSTVNPAIPIFIKDFDIGPVLATWIMVSFMASMGVTMPLTNYLSQRCGRRRLYLTGLIIFIVGSLIGTYATSIEGVLIARTIQGIASGLMIPLSLAIIYSQYPKEERGRVTGIWGAAVMLSPAIGPLFGSLILEYFDWQALFLINIPFAFMAFMLGLRALPVSVSEQNPPFDFIGYALISIGISLLLISTGQLQSIAALSNVVNLIMLTCALLCLMCFCLHSFNTANPLLNLKLFALKGYRNSVIIAVAQAIGMFESLFLLPLLVQIVLGYSPMLTGFLLLFTAIFASIFAQIGGRILDKQGPRLIVSCGLILTSSATLGFGFVSHMTPIWWLFFLAIFRGVGIGLSYIPITTAGINTLPDNMVTQGSVMNNISRRLYSSLALVIGALWLEHSLSTTSVDHSSQYDNAISDVFIATSILVISTLPWAWRFPKNNTLSIAHSFINKDEIPR